MSGDLLSRGLIRPFFIEFYFTGKVSLDLQRMSILLVNHALCGKDFFPTRRGVATLPVRHARFPERKSALPLNRTTGCS